MPMSQGLYSRVRTKEGSFLDELQLNICTRTMPPIKMFTERSKQPVKIFLLPWWMETKILMTERIETENCMSKGGGKAAQ